MQSSLKIALLYLGLALTAPEPGKADAPIFVDEFDGASLDPAWSTRDGYALANPGDVANHASFGVAGSRLTIGIPGGVGHNMWWLEHAQVTRPYEGSGVYEIKVDSNFEDSQQLGIVFESGPGTFVIFMLYSSYYVWGYIEQFTVYNTSLYRTTLPVGGYTNQDAVPQSGPFYLRVIVRDDPDPSLRRWIFRWSRDGSTWMTIFNGFAETSDPTRNIGAIQRVGIFAGNHTDLFTALDAEFDYYRTYPEPEVEVPAVGVAGRALLLCALLAAGALRLARPLLSRG